MIYTCKNCGGNMVYSPERQKMFCKYCGSEDSEQKYVSNEPTMSACPSCGAPIEIREYLSAFKCPYCDNHLIVDERIAGDYLPHLIIPFYLGIEDVKKILRDKFKRSVFAPNDFLSDARLNFMTGMYVPFWMYDYHVHGFYEGTGKKIRTWTSGNRQYTETKIYHIKRDMEVDFDKVPVDASIIMPDSTMDLMEPFHYGNLEEFKDCYLSGFQAEMYNMGVDELEERAVCKAKGDAESIMKSSISGYTGLVNDPSNKVIVERTDSKYALLPVWNYQYVYKNQNYPFYINGQTGKVVGKIPLSAKKVWAYGGTLCMGLLLVFIMIYQIFRWL
ncbi:MAG: hypothetical protein ACI4EX_09700 [Lachnospiraceae bacterium]